MATMTCPQCGHIISADSAFCPDCGFKLGDNMTQSASRLAHNDDAQLRRSKRMTNSWQQRLIPSLSHLKQVGRFTLANGWFILVAYAATLILNEWRWEIFGVFIVIAYCYPLLSGKPSFFNSRQQRVEQPVSQSEPRQAERATSQVQYSDSAKPRRFRFHSNGEFQVGSILIIPSLLGYLITKQMINKRGIDSSQIFNQTGLGFTADAYFICLGVLGIATAMVLGGTVKALTHHAFGGHQLKRWGIVTAVLTILLAITMYQNATTATTIGSLVSSIGAVVMPFLPWLAAICYALGIIQNSLTPQRKL